MPMHDVLSRPACDQARGEGRCRMTAFTKIPKQVEEALDNWNVSASRRTFLKSAGLLVVSFAGTAEAQSTAPSQGAAAAAAGPYPDINYHQLDSWIVIHQDNTATFYVGKT